MALCDLWASLRPEWVFVCVETFPITLETLLESLVCRSHLFTLALHCSQWPRHFHGLSRVACRDCYIECPAWQLWLVSPPASGVSCEPSGPHGGPHYTTSHYLTSCQGSIVPVSCLDWYFAPLLVENDVRKKYFFKYQNICQDNLPIYTSLALAGAIV